jgi:prophage regulatory protein
MTNSNISIQRIEAVSKRCGLPKPSIYRLMKEGNFPQSVKLSPRASGWKSTDIDEWINNLQAVEA